MWYRQNFSWRQGPRLPLSSHFSCVSAYFLLQCCINSAHLSPSALYHIFVASLFAYRIRESQQNLLVFCFQDRESAFSLGTKMIYCRILCSKRAFSDSLNSVGLENFSEGKPPDSVFLLLWSAVATSLSYFVQYEGLHATISKRPGIIACIAWAYKRRRQSISGMKFHMEQGHFGINRMKIVII